MSVSLFKHNEEAYKSVISLLENSGKAAVIHPTGTGKSFIGFKLCEDNPKSKVCWLSPSEYIYKTQIENWLKAGGEKLKNIDFYTYARFMNLSIKEIENIKPNYIVLDEFHRAGAEMWGEGVKKLFNSFPNVPTVGLSATAIRYLDNQRNMVDELFDGYIASEMTLGEAIVRGILNPPKYVLSIFNYKKDLKKYANRVQVVKNKVARDKAEQIFEALRRALDRVEGLDVIFNKHMADRQGKYIVFCANVEHLTEMVKKSKEWFSKIDSEPHIYTAYSDDPETSKAFEEFKKDNSSHLKLLYCIDMLNEGVHVDDVSGVILLRPTVSPIIYKQQIGRALSASKSKMPIIFDIVLNIENLYSIGTIKEEMQVALNYYREFGLDNDIINEDFKVVDEVRDCINLFNSLNDTLTASWDLMYEEAKRYYLKNGNLQVPVKYKTENGYSLGTWLLTQRKVRRGEQYGNLDASRVKKLNAIGMIWDSYKDLSFYKNFDEAKKYYQENGDLKVPATFITENGIKLGFWISNLRTYRKNGIQRNYLTSERIEALNKIGMFWDVKDILWEKNFNACEEFYKENGHLNIRYDYVSKDGLRIGVWIRRIRGVYTGKVQGVELTKEQIERLNSIGMAWDNVYSSAWNKGIAELTSYLTKFGNVKVPIKYVTESGYALGRWLNRTIVRKRELTDERIQQLEKLGVVVNKENSWELRFALAKKYSEKYGNLNMPADYKVNGIWIAKWLNEQRQVYIGKRKGKSLTKEQIEKLKSIGFDFESKTNKKSRDSWGRRFAEVEEYYNEYGNLQIPYDYKSGKGNALQQWLIIQRKAYSKDKLTKDQIERLNKLGMVWVLPDSWEIGYAHAKKYFELYNNLDVATNYMCEDGYKLGHWIQNQRSKYNTPQKYRKLSTEQVFRLKQIGMEWKSDTWGRNYEKAKLYYLENGSLKISRNIRDEDGFCLYSWINDQKKRFKKGELSKERVEKLQNIGLQLGEIKLGDVLIPTSKFTISKKAVRV